jgi:hypothetical protein
LEGDELLQEIAPARNRLIYLWGHLIGMHDRMIVLLGLGDRIKPELDAIFLAAPDRASELPTVAELRESWKQVHDRLNQGVAKLSARQWFEKHTAVSDEDFAKDPLRNRLSILLTRTNHLSYHLGQAALVRR